MKKIISLSVTFLLTAAIFAQKPVIDAESAKNSYGTEILISPTDSSVQISKGKIIISPKKEGETYTISGYFKGQIVNKTKNTVLKLKNAFIENNSGDAAIFCEAKTEISTTKDTENYVLSSGKARPDLKPAAIQGKKDLVLGGSGTLYAKGEVYHAVKADDVKIKGSGNHYLEGTKKGSSLNCKSLTVEKDKTFSAYFLNSKNAVKADESILLQSGNFYLYGTENGFKCDDEKAVKITKDAKVLKES